MARGKEYQRKGKKSTEPFPSLHMDGYGGTVCGVGCRVSISIPEEPLGRFRLGRKPRRGTPDSDLTSALGTRQPHSTETPMWLT